MDKYSVFSGVERLHKTINQKIVELLQEEGYDDLAPSHGDILFAVLLREKLTMQGISKLISRDKSTVTVLVKKLERLGYVTKEVDAIDARIQWILPTEKAADFKPAFLKISNSLLDKFYEGYSEEDKQLLMRFLSRSLLNLEA